MDLKEIEEKLKAPFDKNEIEWRVQQAGKTNDGSIWCMVLAYVDARALQTRLDEVFTPFGWEDSYQAIGEDFICTLTVEINGKKVSKQNGASKTQVEGFKGGISNSFKRVCASGFGIGRYLYDLDVIFAETTTEKPSSKDSDWIASSLKDKESNRYIKYWFKKPDISSFLTSKPTLLKQENVLEIESLLSQTKSDRVSFLEYFGVSKIENFTLEQYKQAIKMLAKKIEKQVKEGVKNETV